MLRAECTKPGTGTPMMSAKYHKMQSHKRHAGYDVIVWTDGSFELNRKVDAEAVLHNWLPERADAAFFGHRVRDNIVDEAKYCSDNTNPYLAQRYQSQDMYGQVLQYLSEGMDADHSGLWECGFFAYRPARFAAVMDLWWKQCLRHTYQDQLSLPYCLWRHPEVHVRTVSRNVYDNHLGVHQGHPAATSGCELDNAWSHDKRAEKVSVDMWDTLAVRTHPDAHNIWRQLEQMRGEPGFTDRRLRAEVEAGTTGENIFYTYERMFKRPYDGRREADWQHQARRAALMEIMLELSQVRCNVALLQKLRERYSGAVVVSDTSWPPEWVECVVKKFGIRAEAVLATRDGKSAGYIWDEVKKLGPIATHVGDNLHSDVSSPKEHGLSASLCDDGSITQRESILGMIGMPNLAGLCRAVRVACPLTGRYERQMWELWSQVYMPWCVVALRTLVARHQPRHVVFLSRDMYLPYLIFVCLFPEIPCEYQFFSRRAAGDHSSNQHLVECMRRACQPPGTVVVDLHGTGRTWYEFAKRYKIKPQKFISCCTYVASPPLPGCDFMCRFVPNQHFLERSFYACHGSFAGYDSKNRVMVLPLEYDPKVVEPYVRLVRHLCGLLKSNHDYCLHRLRESDVLPDLSQVANQIMSMSTVESECMETIQHTEYHYEGELHVVSTRDVRLLTDEVQMPSGREGYQLQGPVTGGSPTQTQRVRAENQSPVVYGVANATAFVFGALIGGLVKL